MPETNKLTSEFSKPYNKAGREIFVSDLYPRVKIPLLWHEEAVKILTKIEKESRDGMSKIMAANALKKLRQLTAEYAVTPR